MRALSLTASLSLAIGCASAPPPVVERSFPEALAPYLRAPLDGYPLALDEERAGRLRQAFERLRGSTSSAAADEVAQGLLALDDTLHPAVVLRAQAAMLDGRADDALALAAPVGEALPTYVAAQLVRGWAAEQTGDVLVAFDAFDAISHADGVADERAEALRLDAIELLVRKVDGDLVAGRVEDAESALARLEQVAPESVSASEAAWWVAIANDDAEAERRALDRLIDFGPERRDVRERLAQLDVDGGDLASGIARYEALIVDYPDDAELPRVLEQSKFRWRLQVLPEGVQDLEREQALDRAQLATLIYWLVPEVRYATLMNPPIATDILDHPQRDQIVRVLNLQLMRIDETRHRFRPTRTVSRSQVLASLLTLLRRSDRQLACLAPISGMPLRTSQRLVCEAAGRCGLLDHEDECLAAADVAGHEAIEMLRRTLDLLGS